MQRDLNFFSVYNAPIDAESGIDRITAVGLIVTGACLVAVLGSFTLFKVSDIGLKKQIASINSYLSSAEVKSAESKLNLHEKKISALSQYAKMADSQVSEFSGLIKPDSALFTNIAKAMPSDVKVLSTSYKNGVFTLSCQSSAELSPAGFVHTLKARGFSDVSYSGESLAAGASDIYTFTVTFSAAGGVSK